MEGDKVYKQTSAEQITPYSSFEDRRRTYEEQARRTHIAEFMGRLQGERAELTEHARRKRIGGFITKFEAKRSSYTG